MSQTHAYPRDVPYLEQSSEHWVSMGEFGLDWQTQVQSELSFIHFFFSSGKGDGRMVVMVVLPLPANSDGRPSAPCKSTRRHNPYWMPAAFANVRSTNFSVGGNGLSV
jgi:hypothetical protein